MCPNQLVFAVTAIAAAVSENRTSDEIAELGLIFTQLGDTLATISFQQALCEDKDNKQVKRQGQRK